MQQLLPTGARIGWLRAKQLARDVATALRSQKRPVCRENPSQSGYAPDAGTDSLLREEPDGPPAPADNPESGARQVDQGDTVVFQHLDEEIDVEPGETILEAGLEADLDLAFSCTMGGCAACALQIVEGEVVYDGPNCLTEEERDSGMCLACVGRPDGRVVLTSRY